MGMAGTTLRHSQRHPILQLKPETDSTGLFNRGLRGFLGCDMGRLTPSSIRGIRVIRGSILPFVALACLLPFSSAALADAAEASPLANPFGVDFDNLDCLTTDDPEEDLLQDRSIPSRLPGGPEQVPNVSADRAKLPSRSDHLFSSFRLHPSSFALTRSVGTVPAFLFPAHSSDSLHQHIRERAPPTPA